MNDDDDVEYNANAASDETRRHVKKNCKQHSKLVENEMLLKCRRPRLLVLLVAAEVPTRSENELYYKTLFLTVPILYSLQPTLSLQLSSSDSFFSFFYNFYSIVS